MTNDMDALFNSAGPLGSDQALSRVQQLLAEHSDLKAEIDTALAILETAKEREREIRHKSLPEAMLNAGTREFVTENGLKAKLVFITDGSLGSPKNEEERLAKEAKLDAIIEYGGGDIVKQTVTLEFPKEMVDDAQAVMDFLVERFETKVKAGDTKWSQVALYRERSVNHQTLGAWIRERMSSGEASEQLPQDFFDRVDIWYGEAAKITPPKPKGNGNGNGSGNS